MITRRDALKLGAAGLVASAVVPGSARAAVAMQEEPAANWPMRGGNPARTGVMPGPGPRFDAPAAIAWEWSTVPGGGWSIPIVHNGVMYHYPADMPWLLAVDFETGTERWRAPAEDAVWYQIAMDTTVFVAAYDALVALDAATGQERWRTPVEGVRSSMVGADDTVYCRTSSSGIVALDAEDGTQRWSFEETSDDSSPITVHDGTLYFASINGVLYALDSETGMERWRLTISPGQLPSESAVIVADGRVYLRDYQGSLCAVDPVAGGELWRTPGDAMYTLSAAHDGRVFGSSSQLGACAHDGATGELLWSVTTGLEMRVSGVAGDTVLAQGTAGAYDMWRVHGLDAATGVERWSFESYPRMYDPVMIGDRLMMHGLVGYVLSNPTMARLREDVTLRGAPSPTGVERGAAMTGDIVDQVGIREQGGGETWVEVTIGEVIGWIPLAAIDPATLPPEGGIDYVYVP